MEAVRDWLSCKLRIILEILFTSLLGTFIKSYLLCIIVQNLSINLYVLFKYFGVELAVYLVFLFRVYWNYILLQIDLILLNILILSIFISF